MTIKDFIKTKIKKELATFPGGIHPRDMKSQTKGKEIIDIDSPDILVFPMTQHLGVPASPCVSVGDEVLVGQKIGEAQGNFSANIHSSVSGKVISIEKRLHPNGAMVESVIIENDRQYNMPEFEERNVEELSKEEIVEIVKEAGIVGMGGATFPAHIKISPPADKKIEYVIINGAECEPYLTSDHRAMLETPDEVIGGLKILMKAYGLDEGYIAIESNKPDAISRMKEYASKETNLKINVVPLLTKYPQGSEKHLVYAITKRRIPKGKLPLDVGASVHNIDSCAAVYRAVAKSYPLIRRIVTVGGDCIKTPANFRVNIGTPVSYLLEKAGGLILEPKKVIMGGPLMGNSIASVDVPVIKGTSGILVFSEKKTDSLTGFETCLRCGKCVKACPMNLLPNVLKLNSENNDFEKLEKLNIMDCIECGSCSFVCPAGQHPVQSIRCAKTKIKSKKA